MLGLAEQQIDCSYSMCSKVLTQHVALLTVVMLDAFATNAKPAGHTQV
jgi:hypothetical protein